MHVIPGLPKHKLNKKYDMTHMLQRYGIIAYKLHDI